MIFWILALVLWGFFASVGSQQGAIRMAISLFGLLLAALLTFRLGNLLRPLLTQMGLENPLWLWALPPLIVFVVVVAAFLALAKLVHMKVDLFYKYKTSDDNLWAWERLNSLWIRTGIFISWK